MKGRSRFNVLGYLTVLTVCGLLFVLAAPPTEAGFQDWTREVSFKVRTLIRDLGILREDTNGNSQLLQAQKPVRLQAVAGARKLAKPEVLAATGIKQNEKLQTTAPRKLLNSKFDRIISRTDRFHAPLTWEPTFTTSEAPLHPLFTAVDLGTTPYKHPPYKPSDPYPEDGATEIPLTITLSWIGGDPDGDTVTYDLYFGTSTPPPLIVSDLNQNSYDLPTLSESTTYYWQVVARDVDGQTAGDVWSFTTTTMTEDTVPPESVIEDPIDGQYINSALYTIRGTASDDASGVQYVQISTDGGTTWRTATGTTTWTYEWEVPEDGIYNLKSKATDNAGNAETPGAGITVMVDRTPPAILAAGYWDTQVSQSAGGDFIMLAVATDEDIDNIEIYIDSQPTGVFLLDDGSQGDWAAGDSLYTLAAPGIAPGIGQGKYLAELVASDLAGNQSMMWPWFEIYEEDLAFGTEQMEIEYNWLIDLAHYRAQSTPGPNAPYIGVGGYWTTRVSSESGGHIDILAYVFDPDGYNDLQSVELYFGGTPTGVFLSDNGPPMDWTAGDGLFMLMADVEAGLSPGRFLVETVARDREGNVSHMYPYFVVDP